MAQVGMGNPGLSVQSLAAAILYALFG